MAHIPNSVLYEDDEPPPRWTFVMINSVQMRFVMQAISTLRKPNITMKIWIYALTYVKQNTGEIVATREQLATDAQTTLQEVSRALSELTRIGAVIREREGGRIIYYVNPSVGWNGEEGVRRAAAHKAPKLQAV